MMKKRNYIKRIVTGISMLMVISSVGCSGNVESSNETTTELENADYMTTEGFVPISEVLEDCEFSCEKDEEHIVYKGEYALDGKDKYEIIFTEDYVNIPHRYIEINGIKKELLWPNSVYKVGIIDIDTTDEYKEIAIYDDGPSGDLSITLVRFDGEEIYELGCFVDGHNNPLLIDKKGEVILGSEYIAFLDTQIVSEYHVLKGNEDVIVHVGYENALNKTYKVSYDVEVAFGESDDTNIENGYKYIENLEAKIDIKKGEEIKLINFDLERDLYYVQLPDGRIGYMTTRLAG